MSSAQKGLLALGGLLFLLMFAGLLCGPSDDEDEGETSTAGSTAEVSETRRLDSEGPRTTNGNARTTDNQPRYEISVYVTGPEGNPVVGANATLVPTEGDDRGSVSIASVGNGGRARLREIPEGRFHLIVTAGGYMTSSPISVRMPDETGREVSVRLLRAARIEASLFLLDGQASTDGIVRIRSTSGGERVFHLDPDERGTIRSGSLESGVWEISWLTSKQDPPDSRMIINRSVNAGELVRLEFTLPDAVTDPAPGRRVGIVEQR